MANEEDKADAIYFQKLLFSEHGVICFHLDADDNTAAYLLESIDHLLPIRLSTFSIGVLVRRTVQVELTSERTRSTGQLQDKETERSF